MVYDLIVSRKLSDKYRGVIGSKRLESEVPITSLSIIVKELSGFLSDVILTSDKTLPEEVLGIIKSINVLATVTSPSEDDIYRLREYLEGLSFYEIEVYFILRPDIASKSELDPGSSYGYLLDVNSDLLPDIFRICSGYGVKFANTRDATMPNAFFNLIDNIAFPSKIDEVIRIDLEKSKYKQLSEIGDTQNMNITKLVDFYDGLGYQLIVCVPIDV